MPGRDAVVRREEKLPQRVAAQPGEHLHEPRVGTHEVPPLGTRTPHAPDHSFHDNPRVRPFRLLLAHDIERAGRVRVRVETLRLGRVQHAGLEVTGLHERHRDAVLRELHSKRVGVEHRG